MNAIETVDLVRRFGGAPVVDRLSLRVPQGKVFGFLGPNGAGKSTTIRLLLGLLRPHAGAIRVLGMAQPRDRLAIAAWVGALVEAPSHYDHLSGRDNLIITQRLLGAPRNDVERVLEIVDLRAVGDKVVGAFSLGMRQRLGLARALLGRPKLLLLDEPTNGLDPAGILDMRRLIRALREQDNLTILVSSHLLAEVEQIADHVGLMHRGRLLAQGELAPMVGAHQRLQVDVNDAPRAHAFLKNQGIASTSSSTTRLTLPSPADAAEINARLVSAGFAVSALHWVKPTLEDLFLKLTAPSPAR